MTSKAKSQAIHDGGAPRRIAVSIPIAAVAAFAFFAFFPKINMDTPKKISESTAISLLDSSELSDSDFIRIQEFSDHSPLFIPTRWNYRKNLSELPLPKTWTHEEKVYSPYGGSLNSVLNFARPAGVSSFEDIFSGRAPMRNVFLGFGRRDSPRQGPPAKSQDALLFTLTDLNTGKIVAEHQVEVKGAANAAAIAVFSVDSFGNFFTRPLLQNTSGDENLDESLSRALRESDILKNIPPGRYRATFSP